MFHVVFLSLVLASLVATSGVHFNWPTQDKTAFHFRVQQTVAMTACVRFFFWSSCSPSSSQQPCSLHRCVSADRNGNDSRGLSGFSCFFPCGIYLVIHFAARSGSFATLSTPRFCNDLNRRKPPWPVASPLPVAACVSPRQELWSVWLVRWMLLRWGLVIFHHPASMRTPVPSQHNVMCLDASLFVEVDEELLCPIGFGVLEEPLTSPCQHEFCARCIEQWLEVKFVCFARACCLSSPLL